MNDDELYRQTVFSSLLTSARLAAREGLALKELKQLVGLAYFREVKRTGASLQEIQERLKVSISSAASLSRQLRDHFTAPDTTLAVPRRVLTLLWSGSMTESGIARALSDIEPEDLSARLAEMVADGRLVLEPGRTDRYALGGAEYRLVAAPWMARIDALQNLMGNVSRAIEARFFERDARAFVRTVTFRAPPDAAERMQALYREQLFELIRTLDAEGTEDPDSIELTLSLLFAPEAPSDPPEESV